MDKTGLLVTRLQELYNRNAGNEQLLVTTQLLLSELEDEQRKEHYYESVAIFFPAATRTNFVNANEDIEVETLIETAPKVIEEAQPVVPEKIVEQPKAETPEPIIHEIKIDEPAKINGKKAKEEYNLFDPINEIPTLALKQQEVNETIAAQQESLNDKMKSSSTKKEVGHNISDAPIKDLRKAIGINDQYLFINELFRGDQVMYDRSIKTINGFNIYGEAELWIKRELKLKLGWNDKSEAVHIFDQLVKRRFA